MQEDALEAMSDAEREPMVAWIETYWNELATFAWQGYVTEGRGIVLLQGDWQQEVSLGYQTPRMAEDAGYSWPQELLEAVQDYTPATDILFLVNQHGSGTLIGMRATPPRLPPREAGQRDGSPPLVSSA